MRRIAWLFTDVVTGKEVWGCLDKFNRRWMAVSEWDWARVRVESIEGAEWVERKSKSE